MFGVLGVQWLFTYNDGDDSSLRTSLYASCCINTTHLAAPRTCTSNTISPPSSQHIQDWLGGQDTSPVGVGRNCINQQNAGDEAKAVGCESEACVGCEPGRVVTTMKRKHLENDGKLVSARKKPYVAKPAD